MESLQQFIQWKEFSEITKRLVQGYILKKKEEYFEIYQE